MCIHIYYTPWTHIHGSVAGPGSRRCSCRHIGQAAGAAAGARRGLEVRNVIATCVIASGSMRGSSVHHHRTKQSKAKFVSGTDRNKPLYYCRIRNKLELCNGDISHVPNGC